jgi:hypothetical protein
MKKLTLDFVARFHLFYCRSQAHLLTKESVRIPNFYSKGSWSCLYFKPGFKTYEGKTHFGILKVMKKGFIEFIPGGNDNIVNLEP